MPQEAEPKKTPLPPIPEMVGATSAPFFIGAGATQISLPMHPPTGPARLAEHSAHKQVFLKVEDVTSLQVAPSFRVYLNVPPGEVPEHYPEQAAGNLGTFGLVESSDPKGEHGGRGMTFILNITAPFFRLEKTKNWNPEKLWVSFVQAQWDGPVPQVRVGRVSLYFQ